MKTHPIRRAFSVTPKIIDAKQGIVDYVASDETVDWYDEVVKVNGWQFSFFRRNSPFVDSHDYDDIKKLLGNVIDAKIENNQLIERVKWAIDVPENTLAQLGWKMTAAGYLKAVSVGFVSLACLRRGDQGFAEALASVADTEDRKSGVYLIHTSQEQLELSACIIGANPNALAKSFRDGVVTEAEMSSLGFGTDDEMNFLNKAAAACESPQCDSVLRAMIGLEMRRIFAARNLSEPHAPTRNGSQARSAAAGDPDQRAGERQEFLKKLSAMA